MNEFTVDSTDDVAAWPALQELATRLGVATEYWDWQGQRVPVKVRTVVAVLGAFGVAIDSLDDAARALTDVDLRGWRQTLPPIVIGRQGQPAMVTVHVPDGTPAQVRVVTEDGETVPATQLHSDVAPREVDGEPIGEALFEVPATLPIGYHRVLATTEAGEFATTLVVSPQSLTWPTSVTKQRSWGMMAQLYSVRSRRSWGIGDFADLADLAAWGGGLGAQFLLINPIHAAQPVPPIEDSPYLPTTRRFVNPLYIRVEAIPEAAYLTPKQAARVAKRANKVRAGDAVTETVGDEQVPLLDRQSAWTQKRKALRAVFEVPRSIARQTAFEQFQAGEGEGLAQFAVWCALNEYLGAAASWPDWALDPDSAQLRELMPELAPDIEFHTWLQWIVDEQLAAAQRAAVQAGMGIGLVTDLAVGVHPTGADVWALRSTMATGVSVGAPPDAFNQRGQNWSQPPWRPDALASQAYLPFRQMIRTALKHAGGLRIDHVMGLFRLWCIPDGLEPGEGAYIRYDYEAMVSILLLEAHRAGALVVGEDLGVVEPFVREYLRERGVLGTSILWFERDEHGQRPPETLRELCLATVTTHDLPPTAGYLAGEHIRLRQRLGLLTRPLEEELRLDAEEQSSVLEMLKSRHLIDDASSSEDVIAALHLLLAQGPSRLLGVMVSDLVGDRRTQNQPGTHTEYPNWRIPLAGPDGTPVLLEDLPSIERATRLAAALGQATSG